MRFLRERYIYFTARVKWRVAGAVCLWRTAGALTAGEVTRARLFARTATDFAIGLTHLHTDSLKCLNATKNVERHLPAPAWIRALHTFCRCRPFLLLGDDRRHSRLA
jgi:hypothetical protein